MKLADKKKLWEKAHIVQGDSPVEILVAGYELGLKDGEALSATPPASKVTLDETAYDDSLFKTNLEKAAGLVGFSQCLEKISELPPAKTVDREKLLLTEKKIGEIIANCGDCERRCTPKCRNIKTKAILEVVMERGK